MTVQMNGNYEHVRINYTEMAKETQTTERVQKAKEVSEKTEIKNVSKLSEAQDKYTSSEKLEKEPIGLYRVYQDENGNRKIFFDDPSKASYIGGKKASKVDENNPEKSSEKCVTNTDKVDREIKKLKEKKQQIEHQIQSASGNQKKIQDLEKKLAQVENELSQKDNDTYRRQNASVSG